jgi:DNA-binding transcriptional LysR family regulator
MDVDLRQLRAFSTIARLASFTRAARVLNLSQPALTVQLRNLEAALGVKLLDRNSRSVALTRVGRELLPTLERVLHDLDAAVADTRGLAAQRHGVVRVAALPSYAAGMLADAISRFAGTHPRVRFEVKDAVSRRVLDMVKAEAADIGIAGSAQREPELEIVHRFHDRMCVVFPAGHPIARARIVGPRELAAHRLILMDPEISVRALVDAAFGAAGVMPTLACEATYMATAAAMVRAGLGITILPESAREIRAERGLRTRVIAHRHFRRAVTVIKKRGRTLPPAAHAFLADIVAVLRAGA